MERIQVDKRYVDNIQLIKEAYGISKEVDMEKYYAMLSLLGFLVMGLVVML